MKGRIIIGLSEKNSKNYNSEGYNVTIEAEYDNDIDQKIDEVIKKVKDTLNSMKKGDKLTAKAETDYDFFAGEVRKIAVETSKDQVLALLRQFGYEHTSQVKKEDYDVILSSLNNFKKG